MNRETNEKNPITEESLSYLQRICSNDFYQNDREFIDIIKKLTKQTASMGNKALGLVNILNEAERIKIQMVQKEIDLGLNDQDKPYGQKNLEKIMNTTLFYSPNNNKKRLIEMFITYLETYFSEEDISKRKEILLSAKALTSTLRDLGEEPKHFIVNREREKVWYILESNFEKTLKQFDIDLFIEKIRLTRIQYQNDFDEMNHYQEERKVSVRKIMKARESGDQKEIDRLQDFIDNGMDVEIKPLLIDTQKVMSSLDYMLEDLPLELNTNQSDELKKFIPAISEYYQDQCHRISGGYAHTPLAKNLKHFQKIIDENLPVHALLDKAEDLDKTMQHLYILHWIAESLLKNIMNNSKSMGMNIKEYDKHFKTTTVFKNIQRSVKIRNDIAHNGLIWNPEEITFAIDTYRAYIEKIAKEQKINLQKFVLPKHNQKMTKADIKRNHKNFFQNQLAIEIETLEKLDSNFSVYVRRTLEKENWHVDAKSKKRMTNKVKKLKQDDFSITTFGYSLKEVKRKLLAHEIENNRHFDETDPEQKNNIYKGLFWLYFNQNDDGAEDAKGRIMERIKGQS